MTTPYQRNPITDYGYIIIDSEEKKRQFEPKQGTDELWLSGGEYWYSVADNGQFGIENHCIYRRPISPGEGYRILGSEEQITNEFQFTLNGKDWLASGLRKSTRKTVASYIQDSNCLAIRVPVKQENQKEMSEDEGFAAWLSNRVCSPSSNPLTHMLYAFKAGAEFGRKQKEKE